MSITKIDDLNFEREYPVGYHNATQDLEFTREGLDINFDTLTWEDINIAHNKLFGKPIEDKT